MRVINLFGNESYGWPPSSTIKVILYYMHLGSYILPQPAQRKVPDLIDFIVFIHNANYYLRRVRCCPHLSQGKFVISFSKNKTCLMFPKLQHRLQQSKVLLTAICSLGACDYWAACIYRYKAWLLIMEEMQI